MKTAPARQKIYFRITSYNVCYTKLLRVSPASNNFINPLDMSKNYSDDESPLVMKSDFILSFCECLVGKQGLSAKEKAIVDRCLTMTYGEYMQDFDVSKTPTLMELYENLKKQPEKEAQGLALSFERNNFV